MSVVLVMTSFYKSDANKYLSISLFLLTSLTLLAWHNKGHFVLKFLNGIRFEYLIAVTLFTYFLVQIQHKHLKKGWYKWLYFPFIVSLIIELSFKPNSSFYISYSESKILIINDVLAFTYNVFLIFWGRYLIKDSDTISEEKRYWLSRLNLFIIGILISWFLFEIEFYFLNSKYASNFLLIILSFLSWWVLYYGVFKLQIIAQKDEIHEYLISKKGNTSAKKKINEMTISKIMKQLYLLMDVEELYKNPLLCRLDLAIRLETSEGYLSQIINQEINKSIIQFVNGYRIEASKRLLHNPVFNKYSIEAIGLESGFKSKSTFYNSFNASLGMSPGAYRKLQKKS